MSDPFRDGLVDALPGLRAFARTFHRDPARADDLVQETMLKAWSKREQFEMGTNLRAWLFRILRNTYLSELRKLKREVEDVDGVHTASLVAKAEQDGHMAMNDLQAALAQLNEEQREALLLVGASGFSYEDAAEIIGVAPGTVKSRVSRGRQRLMDLMGSEAASIEPGQAMGSAIGMS